MSAKPFLGQVQISPGSGFGNQPMFWPGSYGAATPPPVGGPRTQAITTPGGLETNHHCYSCSDGVHRDLTIPQARALEASGISCKAVDSSECPGWKGMPASPQVMTYPTAPLMF